MTSRSAVPSRRGSLGVPPGHLREVTVDLANGRVVRLLALHLHVERHRLGQLGGSKDPGVALGVDHLVGEADSAQALDVGDRRGWRRETVTGGGHCDPLAMLLLIARSGANAAVAKRGLAMCRAATR